MGVDEALGDHPQSGSERVPLEECRLRTLPRAIPESISKDALLSRLRLMGVAMPATFVVSVLFGATLNAGFSRYIAYASIGTAIVIGLPIFTFELFYVYSPLGVGFRRWPFARFIAVRFALWCAWIFIATQLSSHWFSPTEGELFADDDFWWIILFSFAVGFSVVSGLTLNRARRRPDLASRAAWSLVLGRHAGARTGRRLPEMRDGIERSWWTDVATNEVQSELDWLRDTVWRGGPCPPEGSPGGV